MEWGKRIPSLFTLLILWRAKNDRNREGGVVVVVVVVVAALCKRHHHCGQSYKNTKIVNYDSRVVLPIPRQFSK